VLASALHDDWVLRIEGLGFERQRLVDEVIGRVDRMRAIPVWRSEVIGADAVIALADKQSTWRPAEIVREVAALIPTNLAVAAVEVVAQIDGLAARIETAWCVDLSAPIQAGVRLRRDGRPVTEAVSQRALTTATILAEEARILEWAEHTQRGEGVDEPAALKYATVELSVGQAECAAAVAGTKELVVVVGPAGTGKTTALAPAVSYLNDMQVPVFAVAPSAVAAQVLAAETGVRADTIDKFLYEHRRGDGPRPEFQLPVGGVLLVDEAGMASTGQLAEIAALAQDQRWRVRLVGDPLQFSAVGRGGMFAMLTHASGEVIELDRVHRFDQPWERDASLRLRREDPDIAKVYAAHDRIRGGTPEEMTAAIIDAWWHARGAGGEVAMMAASNETVVLLSDFAQARRLAAGELDVTMAQRFDGSRWLCVGDEVVTRRNQRDLTTDQGIMVKNRDRFTITGFTADGVTVSGRSGTVTLPSDYAWAHFELGYAQTGHGSQGRTVDTALLLIDGPVDVRDVYVPMTRGRDSNTAFVACADGQDPVEVFAEAIGRDWIDRPALVRHQELNAAIESLEPRLLSPLRVVVLFDREETLAGKISDLEYTLRSVPRRLEVAEEKRAGVGERRDETVKRIDSWETELARLERFGHRHHNRHQIVVAHRQIDGDRQLLAGYDDQIVGLDATIVQCRHDAAQLNEPRAALRAYGIEYSSVRCQLGDDIQRRAIDARDDPTMTETIGPRPHDGRAGARWDPALGSPPDTTLHSDGLPTTNGWNVSINAV
jgi:hypothetical protein